MKTKKWFAAGLPLRMAADLSSKFELVFEERAQAQGTAQSTAEPSQGAFDVVTALFNATVEQAHGRGLLSGEHFSVNGTLIQAWASHQSLRRKDGSDDDQSPDDWRGQSRSNETHASTSDPDSRLYRKSNGDAAQLCYLGHVLTDNRHGLVVNVRASQANGRAEEDANLIYFPDFMSSQPGLLDIMEAIGYNPTISDSQDVGKTVIDTALLIQIGDLDGKAKT